VRIGEHLNVDPITVLNRLRERGIPRETPTDTPEHSGGVGMSGDDAYMFDGRCPTYVETVSCSGSCSYGMPKS
jgi:hypothetical protein